MLCRCKRVWIIWQENEQDYIVVKSRARYIISFIGVPLQWVSKLQTKITLSTMEVEYITIPINEESHCIKYEQGSIFIKHRTECLITFMDISLQWASNIQSQIAWSTMKVEYTVLSQSIRDLIVIRENLKEISSITL